MRKIATRLSPTTIAHITDMIFDGFPADDIAFFHNLSVRCVNQLQSGELNPSVRRAVISKKAKYIKLIRDGKGKQWTRIAWFLERRYPKEFARPEIQLANSTSVVNNTLVISSDQADALIKRSTRLAKEADALFNNNSTAPAAEGGLNSLDSEA